MTKYRNGMEYKGNHLRVDQATKSKVHDNASSVFLGALAFGKEFFKLIAIN